jgi:hypothetical protein
MRQDAEDVGGDEDEHCIVASVRCTSSESKQSSILWKFSLEVFSVWYLVAGSQDHLQT